MKTRILPWLAASALALCLCACGGTIDPNEVTPSTAPAQTPGLDMFYKGTTMSFASYLQDLGLVYRENGNVTDPYESLVNHGGNCVRLQLDMVPFNSFEGTDIDWQSWDRVVADAKKAQSRGLSVFLTLKPDYDIYSSGPTDHNNLPPAWSSLSEEQIGKSLFDWVFGRLVALANEGVYPALVAVGNEVNLGFLKSRNVVDNTRTGRLLKYGFQAVRNYAIDYNPACLSVLHIADPSRAEYAVRDIEAAGGDDYDVLALSYYPGSNIGHGAPLGGSFSVMAKSFSKPLMVLETAYSFNYGYDNGKWLGDDCNNAYNYPDWNAAQNEMHYTPAMGRSWLGSLARDIKMGGGVGLITWGTESLPDEPNHGKKLYTYPAPWAHGSTWENNSYWDFSKSNNLHEGIDWMQDVR